MVEDDCDYGPRTKAINVISKFSTLNAHSEIAFLAVAWLGGAI